MFFINDPPIASNNVQRALYFSYSQLVDGTKRLLVIENYNSHLQKPFIIVQKMCNLNFKNIHLSF
jgi:hypothetical protein